MKTKMFLLMFNWYYLLFCLTNFAFSFLFPLFFTFSIATSSLFFLVE